jgi:hypothetical protein
MTDLEMELRACLMDVAAVTPIPALPPRPSGNQAGDADRPADLRGRRGSASSGIRRRNAAAVVGGIAVAATCAGVFALVGIERRASTGLGPSAPDASPSGGRTAPHDTAPCGGSLLLPTWKPASVEATYVSCGPAGQASGGQPGQPTGVPGGPTPTAAPSAGPGTNEVVFTLNGAANSDTLPEGVPEDDWDQAKLRAGAYHSATVVNMIEYVGSTRIQESLSGSGNEVETVDLGSGVEARVTTPSGGLGALRVEWVVAGNSYLLLSARGTTASGPSGLEVGELVRMAASSVGRAKPASPGAATRDDEEGAPTLPGYLPDGVTLVRTDPVTFTAPESGTVNLLGAYVQQFALPGVVNSDTLTVTDRSGNQPQVGHQETRLSISVNPSVTELPDDFLTNDGYAHRSTVQWGQVQAIVTTMPNGLGVERVDWIDAAGYHVVMTERLTMPEGLAGLPLDEVVRIAESVAVADR